MPSDAPQSLEIVHPERLGQHVRMLAEICAPRDYRHPKNLDRAAAYIHEQLAASGARVRAQGFRGKLRRYRNVIGSFGPAEGDRIIIGAHYDVAGPYPGADDNASGVAVLLELAPLLRQHPPKVRTDLIGYALEEPPFFGTPHMGSAVHAATLSREGADLRAMISLEMVGYYSEAPGSQLFPSPELAQYYPDRGNFILVVGDIGQKPLVDQIDQSMKGKTPLLVYSIAGLRSIPGIDLSDHSSYWDHGYPAVMITDTANYRNKAYHTADDTADRLDYQRMAYLTEALPYAIASLSAK